MPSLKLLVVGPVGRVEVVIGGHGRGRLLQVQVVEHPAQLRVLVLVGGQLFHLEFSKCVMFKRNTVIEYFLNLALKGEGVNHQKLFVKRGGQDPFFGKKLSPQQDITTKLTK